MRGWLIIVAVLAAGAIRCPSQTANTYYANGVYCDHNWTFAGLRVGEYHYWVSPTGDVICQPGQEYLWDPTLHKFTVIGAYKHRVKIPAPLWMVAVLGGIFLLALVWVGGSGHRWVTNRVQRDAARPVRSRTTFPAWLLLLALLLSSARPCAAQVSNVMIFVDEVHTTIFWNLGDFQIEKCETCLDSNGSPCHFWVDGTGKLISAPFHNNKYRDRAPIPERLENTTHHTITEVVYRSHHVSIPLPPWAVAVIGVIILLLLGWLTVSFVRWVFTRRRETESAGSGGVP